MAFYFLFNLFTRAQIAHAMGIYAKIIYINVESSCNEVLESTSIIKNEKLLRLQ